MASRHQIARQSLPVALAESLRERILSGEFKEGEPLIQETLAREYEVSRMPVREALRQLEALGLVILRTHKGAVVTSMRGEQIKELFDLRALLECDVLERALPKFTDEQLTYSTHVLKQLEKAYHIRDASRWGKLNFEFHRSLYLPAGRPETLSLIETVNVQTDRYVRLNLNVSGALTTAKQEHRELLRLYAARDPATVEYLRGHIIRAGSTMPIPSRSEPEPTRSSSRPGSKVTNPVA